MARRRLTYWERRAVEQEKLVHQGLNVYQPAIAKAYADAQKYLTRKVNEIYRRYLSKSDLDEEEVRTILNAKASAEDIMELKQMASSIEDNEIRKQVKDFLNLQTVKHRITRLEALKAKSYVVSKKIADVQLKESTNYFIDTIHQSHKQASAEAIIGKTEEVFDVYEGGNFPRFKSGGEKPKIDIVNPTTGRVVKTIQLEPEEGITEFKELSTRQTKNILDQHWHGNNYSGRIWNDTDTLANRLQELFTVKEMTGMSEREMSKKIADEFGVAINVAKRLIRTEANYMANQAKLKGWIQQGVKRYMLVAVLDLKTSDICKNLDGKDFAVEEAVVNGKYGTFPPFHPWCRTIAIAFFGERSRKGTRTVNDPLTGKTFTMSRAANYKDWEKMLIEKHSAKDLDIERHKIRNYKTDRDQWRRWRRMLGDEVPEEFEDFQEMKYRDVEKYEELMNEYRSARISS